MPCRDITGLIAARVALVVVGSALVLVGCAPEKAPPAKKTTATKTAASSDKCVDCHTRKGITGSALRDWRASKHHAEDVGCADCHVPGDEAPKRVRESKTHCEDKSVRRLVSSQACADCHEDQVEQFKRGKHAKAWLAMEAMPTTANQPAAAIDGQKACGGCHRIGRDQGKCDSCHTRHLFAAAEARRPEACATCHMGFDHAQWEMYSTSKHGMIYRTQGDKWHWDKKLSELYGPNVKDAHAARSPVCATCHMPGGDHAVRTAWGFLALRLPEPDKEWEGYRLTILKGLGILDASGKPTARLDVVKAGQLARLSSEDWIKERERMVAVCKSCHAESFARKELTQADELIKASDKLMAEAVTIVQKLYDDGILDRPKDYPASVDLLRFYEVEHPIEQTLYVMFLKHRQRSFQGAFHMNPDYQHWYGWAQLKRDLKEIRHADKELRKSHRR
jgi:hydroxylamine dehydrogenase